MNLSTFCLIRLYGALIALSGIESFSPNGRIFSLTNRRTPPSFSSLPTGIAKPIGTTGHHRSQKTVVFSSTEASPVDKLSGECLAALMVAEDLGRSYGISSIQIELLLMGVVSKPERAQETLDKYGFTKQNVSVAVEKLMRFKPSSNDVPSQLPLSGEVKSVLDQAMNIADHLGSRSIRSEHVVLALMGYNYGKLINSAPIFPILNAITGLEKEFRCFKFCQDLEQSLIGQPNEDTISVGKERRVVVGGRQQVTGATLAQVGVDLTQRAMEGQLDRVYGRDEEIISALRTLGRRRKNNPCLVGEAGTFRLLCLDISDPLLKVWGKQLLPRVLLKFWRQR